MAHGKIRIDKAKLEEMMKLRGLSVAGLAEKTGMHYNSILRVRTEQSTSLTGLEAICNALECHPFDLIVAEGYPKPFLAVPASL